MARRGLYAFDGVITTGRTTGLRDWCARSVFRRCRATSKALRCWAACRSTSRPRCHGHIRPDWRRTARQINRPIPPPPRTLRRQIAPIIRGDETEFVALPSRASSPPGVCAPLRRSWRSERGPYGSGRSD